MLICIILIILEIFILSLLEFSRLNTTPGKYLLNLKVVNNNESKLSFLTILKRNIVKKASQILLIPYIYILFTSGNTTYHDKVTNTTVIPR